MLFLNNMWMRTHSCVTVWVSLDQSSKRRLIPRRSPNATPLILLPKRKQGARNAIYACPTTSRGWVGITHLVCTAEIGRFLWRLPSCIRPFADSGKTERKRETAGNNEAWDQLARQENGFSVVDVPLNSFVGLTRVTGRVLDSPD